MRRSLAVISKVDLVDGRPAMEEAVALMARNGIVGPAIGASALTGEGVAEIRGALAVLTKGAPSPADCGFCHLPVDRVFSLPGHGTVVTGTLRRGPIAVGDTVAVVPGGLAARVRGLELHGRPVASAPRGAGSRSTCAVSPARRCHVAVPWPPREACGPRRGWTWR